MKELCERSRSGQVRVVSVTFQKHFALNLLKTKFNGSKVPKIYFLNPISRLRPGQMSQFTLIPEPSGQRTSICSFPPGKQGPETESAYLASFSGDRPLPPRGPRPPQPSAEVWCTGSASHGHISTGAGLGGGSLRSRAASKNQF